MGVVSPVGCSLDEFWSGVRAGESAAAPIDEFDLSRHRVRFGCRVRGFRGCDFLSSKEARRLDPFASDGVAAAWSAFEDAGSPRPEPTRAAVVTGNAVGGRLTSDNETRNYVELGPPRVHPLMMRAALNRLQAHSETTVMIGDRMDTDVVAGLEAGMRTVLVLTGITHAGDIDRFPFRPSRVVDSIAALVEELPSA